MMRDPGRVRSATQGDSRAGRDRGDARQTRRGQGWWFVAAASVVLAGGGCKLLLRAQASGDVDLRSAMPAAFSSAVTGEDVIIVATPQELGMQASVGGVLRLDGRCLIVDHPAGLRSAVVWPAGTRWLPSERVVVHASGARIRLGDTFYTGGGYIAAHGMRLTGWLDPSSVDRAVACGGQAGGGGDVVVLGPFPINVE